MFVKTYFLPIAVLLCIGIAWVSGSTVFQKKAPSASPSNITDQKTFENYWFKGKAEINTYSLQQAQYGELNPGEAVLIFVTEDFRTDTQVKLENEENRHKSTPVLKLNSIHRFVTGIYDYSIYTSVFTPIDPTLFPQTLKVSSTSQDWCGHTFLQLNFQSNGYKVTGRSYFETHATEDYTSEKALLEDELWTRLRLSPDRLPVGSIRIIPSVKAARLRHQKIAPLSAIAGMEPYKGSNFTGKSLKTYKITYTDGRMLQIVFEQTFPYRIMGWEDTYTSKGKQLTTRAIHKKTLQSAYWERNSPEDRSLRDTLHLQ
ncbi:hypothetical protein [Runella slithyformis]|uniref:Septum formation inhibitor Maf n=1 Tax=Runella slithyformis (strain ATCC 29530 / DSM 19594 / LMG 11500 / NCIMB 11436 / LSU 4) TaxID=761193 RepID=A0A7U3ZKM6_RUNSL|nr:hypothetical protein [Runella slithyformis]AEI48949.1 hypothetical protein Runsl_2548 [Runella slithyformis DSM 19594]